MAKGIRICKVCGREYEYCHTARKTPGIFRWQDVACCQDHGSIYLSRIIASRSGSPTKTEENHKYEYDDYNVDDDDELIEDEFDDSDEDIDIEL